MNEIPLTDIVAQNEPLWPELNAALAQVYSGAQFVLGPAVERFEQEFAAYVGARHAVGVNSGTSALMLALRALDVGPGDEVITTPLTWISSTSAIRHVGARPVFVDVDPVTYTLDPEQVEQAVTPRTKAILPVHLYGQTADLTHLAAIVRRHHLALVEDAAQAHGALHAGKRVGSLGHFGCFSFHPGKNLGSLGEAGGIVTNDDALADRVRRLRNHAQASPYQHLEIGYNARMEGVQGAVLSVKLRYLDRWNSTRSLHAERYWDLLRDCPHLTLPRARSAEEHVWFRFVVLPRDVDRDLLRAALAELGIETGIHYPTLIPFQPAHADLGYRRGDFPIAEFVAEHCLSLPIFPELREAQLERVAETLWELLSDPDRLVRRRALSESR
jgi:dTDP-4-amino-4,6-dideoxygalactose transaminase